MQRVMIIARNVRRPASGFTMIEMLVVIGIIVILAGITFGLVSGVSDRGRTARAETQLRIIAQSLEQYRSHYGDYPWINVDEYTQNEDAETDRTPELLFNALAGVLGPQGHNIVRDQQEYGPFFVDFSRLTLLHTEDSPNRLPDRDSPDPDLENRFVDPWGNPYRYYYKDANDPDEWRRSQFVLYSMGPDGSHEPPDNEGDVPDSDMNADNIYHDD